MQKILTGSFAKEDLLQKRFFCTRGSFAEEVLLHLTYASFAKDPVKIVLFPRK